MGGSEGVSKGRSAAGTGEAEALGGRDYEEREAGERPRGRQREGVPRQKLGQRALGKEGGGKEEEVTARRPPRRGGSP